MPIFRRIPRQSYFYASIGGHLVHSEILLRPIKRELHACRETTSVLVAPTATAIWRKRGATKQNKRGQHTPENATELTMTTSRAAVEGRALLSDMLRCATLSMLALASQASRRHVSPPLGAPHNHSRRATRTPRRAWGRCRCAQAELQLGSLVAFD